MFRSFGVAACLLQRGAERFFPRFLFPFELRVAQDPALLPTFPEGRNVNENQYTFKVKTTLTIDLSRNGALYSIRMKLHLVKLDL